MAGLYANSTIGNYVSSVRAWHILHGIEWSLLHENETDALLKAARALSPPSSKRAPREPYTIGAIESIHNHLDLNTPLHAAVFACLTTTFFATARTGEFTVPNLNAFNPLMHIAPQHVSVQHDRQGLEVTNFRLPWTKSAPQGEDVYWAKQNGLADPHSALDHHWRINDPPPNAHLFAYRVPNGPHRPLTKPKFLKTLEAALKQANAPALNGHGIRIGSTLEYLLRNVPFDVVKVKGRWASDAFLVYLRRHAQVLAPYLQATPALHNDFLRTTLPPVRG